MISGNAEAFDAWIRCNFREMNTELETLYFAREKRHSVDGVGDSIKNDLLNEGRDYVIKLLKEPITDASSENAYNVLGCVGLYMAACRRHDITEPSRENSSPLVEASALAMYIGSALGVTPRFATSHMADRNYAINGVYRGFTSLKDENLFFDYNTLSMFAYMRAADALRRIVHLGISHPLSYYLFCDARVALEDVSKWGNLLFNELDVERFFFCVRPYLKPHRVGAAIYRGGNAGDFAGINIVDLFLGLCDAKEMYYSQLLIDKFLFMLPEEQALLKDCMRRQNFMDKFIEAMLTPQRHGGWYKKNLGAFLAIIEMHGQNAEQHHNQLVRKFIEVPAAWLPEDGLTNITASGPPLPVLLKALEKLRDLRMGASRTDICTRHQDIQRLKASI